MSVCEPAEHVKVQKMLGVGCLAQNLPLSITMLERKCWIFWGGNNLISLVRHGVFMAFFALVSSICNS